MNKSIPQRNNKAAHIFIANRDLTVAQQSLLSKITAKNAFNDSAHRCGRLCSLPREIKVKIDCGAEYFITLKNGINKGFKKTQLVFIFRVTKKAFY
ncbi:hypothetical protein D3C76_1688290 [compost metagenome]